MERYSHCPLTSTKYFKKNVEGCLWIQHPQNKRPIGEGADAKIYQICCQKGEELFCNYVVKYQEPERNDKFKSEVEMHKKFESLGIGIKMLEAYMCPEEGSFLVMEKKDFNPEQYVKSLLLDKSISSNFILTQIDNMEKEALEMVEKAFHNNLDHNDLTIYNIMLDKNPDDTYSNLVLIDFGKAVERKLSPKQIEDNLEDFKLSFERLRGMVKERDMISPDPLRRKAPPEVKKMKKSSKKVYDSPKVARRGMMFDDEDFKEIPLTPKKGLSFDDDEGFSTPKKSPKKGLSFDDDDEGFSTPKKGLSFDFRAYF